MTQLLLLLALLVPHHVDLTPVGGGPLYNVYRADGPCGDQAMALVNAAPFSSSYEDDAVVTGVYCYSATSVAGAAESGPTVAVEVRVPHGTRTPWYTPGVKP